jgi:hypothetical protein
VSGAFGRKAEVTKLARHRAIATEVQRETDGHHTPPRTGLISRMGNGLRRLVRPRNLKAEERIDTAESRRRTGGDSVTTRYSMDAGITGGLSLLFGNSED